MTTTCLVKREAHHRMVLHSLKHVSATILGVAIGSKDKDGNITVEDVVPLSHSHLLAPMLKLGFSLVETHCQETRKSIVGVYHAQGCSYPASDKLMTAIFQKVKSSSPGAVIMTVDTTKAAIGAPCVTASRASDVTKLEVESFETSWLTEAIKNMTHLRIFDLDDHLVDPSVDFISPLSVK